MSAATVRERLQWLASAHGIEPGFHDIWGRPHEVSDDGLRVLLREFGVAADCDADVDRGLAATHLRYWHRLAEPVLVVAAPATALEVRVRLPRRGPAERIAWRLVTESGAATHGEADVDALALRERADVDGVPHDLRTLGIAASLPPGYHRLELRAGAAAAGVLVVAAPPACYRPPRLDDDARVWGWSVQLYGLRSPRNWGVGDFGDLLALIDVAALRGASAVGLNPLHARFAHDPGRVSPYAPSSRLWLDALAIDVEAVDDFAESDAVRARVGSDDFRARVAALRAASLVDFDGVSAAKHEVLRELYAHFRDRHLAHVTARAQQFRAFQAQAGAALRRHASFEALHEAGSADPPAIERIEYHEYLQWQADLQLGRAAERCEARGMAVGLYLDLAVSVDRAGSDAWSFADCYAASASVGAPPDDFNLSGQDWGLPPLIPEALRERGHEPFVLALRANMRHAGALRIDHVMGLMRLYWVPRGAAAREGAYVRYPLDELLAIVALESHRNCCLVVGEDLGTVPDAVREALARSRVLSYRLLYFERDASGGFAPPAAWPREALVSIRTHDLPTLAGWWNGHDLQLRDRLGLYPDADTRGQHERARERDRIGLLAALASAGRLPADADVELLSRGPLAPMLVDAIHAWLASTPSRLMMVQPEDWIGTVEQCNVPGTVDEHPNWRRKLALSIDELRADAAGERLARVLAAERPAAADRCARFR
jgi:(1->4)-alpha-D-glucan 1-alpha-D-glucosylmutase